MDYSYYLCDTQTEADSVKCVLNPTAEGCLTDSMKCEQHIDSLWVDNVCIYRCLPDSNRCDSASGTFTGLPLPDTLETTAIVGKCYYNCATHISADSTFSMVTGNIQLTGPGGSVSDGIRVPNDFEGTRYNSSGTYLYNYLSPVSYSFLDSVFAAGCSSYLYRGVKDGKYIYWYDTEATPDSVTNIVRVK